MEAARLHKYRMTLAMMLVSLSVSACARNALDDVYEASLQMSQDVLRQDIAEIKRWEAEDESWRRGELGPGAARPPKPKLRYDQEVDAMRMRLMERELIAFLGRRCADRAADCALAELKQLGFSCTDAAPVSCSLLNTAYGEYDNPIKRSFERHQWTVTITAEQGQPTIAARAELAEPR